ncbi:MAG: histidine phosphatase family protein [Patescibacteria group bacterium]|jgi:broad specificity phosphatase PhoE
MSTIESLIIIRHGQSAYNELRERKKLDPAYVEFLGSFPKRRSDPDLVKQAALCYLEHTNQSLLDNFETPLTEEGKRQSYEVGRRLKELDSLSDVIFVSPHIRAIQTYELILRGWPELKKVKIIEDERLREQERGLYLNYNDWKIFTVFHPEQEDLMNLQGHYWYRYPQGENIPDVRLRINSWLDSLDRKEGSRFVAITHHIPILALRANLEEMNWPALMDLDKRDTPINCGVTSYARRMNIESLSLEAYNQKFY